MIQNLSSPNSKIVFFVPAILKQKSNKLGLSVREKIWSVFDLSPIPLLAKKFSNSMAVIKLGILHGD